MTGYGIGWKLGKHVNVGGEISARGDDMSIECSNSCRP